jgi:nucleoid-associated protein YgaU
MKTRRIVLLAALSLALAALTAASVFAADVARGQFYTEEEYQKLSGDEREAYCASLANEKDRQANMLSEYGAQLEAERRKVADLTAKIRNIDAELQPLETRHAELQKEIDYYNSLPTQWTVKRDECLYKISAYEEIYADGTKWPRIYRANRDQIVDPNLIYVDQILAIPRGLPMMHTVIMGEYLAKIAGYWEIYDDWRQWTRIYEANKDKISDPDLIHPDQVFDIPR